MISNRLAVNCILQVKDNNRLDVEEWLKYHIALGFDNIFVCDSGNHTWLDEVCMKLKDFVTLAPRKPEWAYQSEIIKEYVSRREYEEWCICLTEHDFLWIAPNRAKNIIDFVDTIPGPVCAVTFYVRHMSSKEPMRYRVGTQLDCFVHARREPEGFVPQYNALPNTGVTMFRVMSRDEMPLVGPVEPTRSNNWADAEMRQMSMRRFTEETTSKRFRVMSYPARIYRFALRSGDEMQFDDKKVPVGFDVCDLSMQNARAAFCHVDVNPDTETIFAKHERPVAEDTQAKEVPSGSGSAPEVELPTDAEVEARTVPITRARVDKLIFKGMFLDDVVRYVDAMGKPYDRDTLERMFDEERQAITASSSLYTTLQEMIDQKMDSSTIRHELMLTETTLSRMMKALPVLDIKTKYATDDYDIGGESVSMNATESVSVQLSGTPANQADPLSPSIDMLDEINDGDAVMGELVDALHASEDTPETADAVVQQVEPPAPKPVSGKTAKRKSSKKKSAVTAKKSRRAPEHSKSVESAIEVDTVVVSACEIEGGLPAESAPEKPESYTELDQVGVLAEIDADKVVETMQSSK